MHNEGSTTPSCCCLCGMRTTCSHPDYRRVRETSLDANHTAGEHTTKTVCREAGAEHRLDLVFQDKAGLVTA